MGILEAENYSFVFIFLSLSLSPDNLILFIRIMIFIFLDFVFLYYSNINWDKLTIRNGLVCIRTVSVNGISGFSAIGTPFRVNVCNIDQ